MDALSERKRLSLNKAQMPTLEQQSCEIPGNLRIRAQYGRSEYLKNRAHLRCARVQIEITSYTVQLDSRL